MNILWHGQSFFEIQAKGPGDSSVKIAVDPFGEGYGLKVPKVEADILLVSHQHHDHSNKEAVKGNYFLIDSPGEYEVKGVFVKAIPAFHDNNSGRERGEVVIFKIETEAVRLCHLSDLGQKELFNEQLEEIGDVDVLFVPVGGVVTVNAKEASSIVSQIEPKIVIPMHYKIPGLTTKSDLAEVKDFLKVMGQENMAPQPKIKITQKDLAKEETEIIVLQP
ncbi:MAG: MBL fold metallo-hydrolase [Patescibacteria group bacterium]|nr:MBL fold metallo-hydrolase [Patescibacteria group bacterium]